MKEFSKSRVFFAIPVSKVIILPLRKKMISLIPHIEEKVRWAHPSHYHITVRFLGDSTAQQIKSIIDSAQDCLPHLFSFDLSFQWMGFFPPTKQSRLFAVQFIPPKALSSLYNQLNLIATEQGYREETRPYLPHITLFKTVKNLSHSLQIEPIPIKGNTCSVNQIILYESRPSDLGSDYIPLHVFQLKEKPV